MAKEIQSISILKKFLDDNDYDLLIQNVLKNYYTVNPLPNYNLIENYINYFPEKQRMIIKLFYLGDKINYKKFISYFDISLIEHLCAIDIMVNQDNEFIQMNRYIIVSYLSLYFLVSTPYYYPHCIKKNPDVYIGHDTYSLANNILSLKCDNILDLCSGSGIQIIVACKKSNAKHGVGVEINEEAATIARINCLLNGMDNIIEIHNSSLYESVHNEKFDIIYSNPPFIPVPKDINYPICGDGGEDGLSIVRDIMEGYNNHLHKNGYGIMFGEAIATSNNILLSNIALNLLNNFSTKLFLLNLTDSDTILKRVVNFTENIENYSKEYIHDRWSNLYDKLGANRYYSFILKTQLTGNFSFDTIDLTNKWTKNSKIPKIKKYHISEENKVYTLSSNLSTLKVSELGLRILETAHTNQSIIDLAQALQIDYPNIDYNALADSIMNLYDQAFLMGFIEKFDK